MKDATTLLTATLLILCLNCRTSAAPPKVVKATPDNGAKDVDPTTKQIVVVFDQPMDRRGRSIVGGGESFPEIVGQPTWSNDRTIVMNVKLKPDHDYWLSINNPTFKNFANTKGESAVPYPIAFSTAPAKDAADKLTPEVNRKAIAELRKFIDDDYSYKDLRGIDWDKLFADNAPKLEKAESASAFARQAGEMLAAARDIHLFLKVGDRTFASGRRSVPANLDLKTLQKTVPKWKEQGGGVATGKFDDGVTYLFIGSWSNDVRASLDPAYAAIGTADPKKGIVIDVRANSGGSEDIAREVAGCFVSEAKVYSKNTIRHDGKTEGPFDRIVEPNRARPSFRGPVAVLIGQYCMSSNESFILMMKAAGATLVGEKTYGSSGNPKPHELSNGVTVFLPSWRDLRPDGTCLEGEGVAPDVAVKAADTDFQNGDPVLDAALKLLKK